MRLLLDTRNGQFYFTELNLAEVYELAVRKQQTMKN